MFGVCSFVRGDDSFKVVLMIQYDSLSNFRKNTGGTGLELGVIGVRIGLLHYFACTYWRYNSVCSQDLYRMKSSMSYIQQFTAFFSTAKCCSVCMCV